MNLGNDMQMDTDADLAIRPAGLTDLAQLLVLYKQLDIEMIKQSHRTSSMKQLLVLYKQLDIEPKPELPIEQARERFLDLATNSGHRIYVAEFERKVVGTFALIFVGGIPHGARDSCIVEDVVVAPELQGTGIGRRMMRFAMQRCAAGNCYKLVLSSHLNRSGAHQFYESLGFRKHGYSYLIDRFDDDGGAD